VSPFFDTNLLIYAQQSGDKADRARALFAGGGVLSVQVLNEFAAVAHRKLGKDWDAIDAAIEDILALVEPPQPLTLATHKAARALARAHRFAFYDALIVAAAVEAGCDTLLTEDMQDGRQIGALMIVDPFTPGTQP
jgi:predicted nucleic acid-binding protein